jgi:hypothetical protein
MELAWKYAVIYIEGISIRRSVVYVPKKTLNAKK